VEEKYECILDSLTRAICIGRPKLNNICNKLGYLAKIEMPTLHWAVTNRGRSQLMCSNFDELVIEIEDALCDLEDGPDLGKPPEYITKICAKCRKKKRFDFFGESKKTTDGLTARCNSCW
jgi:hypothetical protein